MILVDGENEKKKAVEPLRASNQENIEPTSAAKDTANSKPPAEKTKVELAKKDKGRKDKKNKKSNELITIDLEESAPSVTTVVGQEEDERKPETLNFLSP